MNEQQEWKSLRVDHRHLAFFFIGAVAVCAVFFAVGFVVGRAQAFETALKQTGPIDKALGEHASELTDAARTEKSTATADAVKSTATEANTAADYRKELDFYSSLRGQKVDQNFHPEPEKTKKDSTLKSESKIDAARTTTQEKNKSNSPGSLISLQVAALKSASEADKLVKSLRSKGYPVFVVNPSSEDASRLIRVQIGPYSSEAEAAKMKNRLGTDGYTAITKR